uniref:Short-chain dehydrogenase n=1 Tax=Panagrolaimus sp. JU765 TaxID=591449 RepID=A0AC34QKW8_9BILA
MTFGSNVTAINGNSDSAQLSRDIVARNAHLDHVFNNSGVIGNADVEKQEYIKNVCYLDTFTHVYHVYFTDDEIFLE